MKKILKIIVIAGLVYELSMLGTPDFHYANALWWGIVLGAGWLDEGS